MLQPRIIKALALRSLHVAFIQANKFLGTYFPSGERTGVFKLFQVQHFYFLFSVSALVQVPHGSPYYFWMSDCESSQLLTFVTPQSGLLEHALCHSQTCSEHVSFPRYLSQLRLNKLMICSLPQLAGCHQSPPRGSACPLQFS